MHRQACRCACTHRHDAVELLLNDPGYPGKPPKFECTKVSDNVLELLYQSPRCLGDVAEGLIQGCAAYYGDKITVKRERLGDKSGAMERFTITK